MLKKIIFIGMVFFFYGEFSFAQEESRGPLISYDLGASVGSIDQSSYVEGQLGLNWHIRDWVIWRNAAFYRSQSHAEDFYGLDSSARFQVQLGQGPLSLRLFGGPGLRFPSRGKVAPTAEAGAVVRLGGLSLGGGARVILNEWVDGDLGRNDTMFFLILSGGGIL